MGRAPWWFHVASSGELEQCVPILESLHERQAGPVFLSYFSPTAERAIQLEKDRRERAGLPAVWSAADYCPWDIPSNVDRYLGALSPRRLVVIHREIWPMLLRGCSRREIPAALAATSFRTVPRWYRPGLRRLDAVATVNTETRDLLIPLSPDARVVALGDPRRERALARAERGRRRGWHLGHGEPVLVLGSLWPEDFDALRPGLERIFGEWRIVLVPHQPDEQFVERLLGWARKLGSAALWSRWREKREDVTAVVVDTVGELAEIYSLATAAFVGGSFRSRVHNVLEPAAYGIPVLTGPRFENSLEARELVGVGLSPLLPGDDIARVLGDAERLRRLGEGVRAYFLSAPGTGSRYADFLLSL